MNKIDFHIQKKEQWQNSRIYSPFTVYRLPFTVLLLFLLLFFFFSCQEKEEETTAEPAFVRDLDEIIASGELVVLTMYGATDYYVHRGKSRGYQYEMARRFARELGVTLRLQVVGNKEKMEEMMLTGEGDLIAYRLPVTMERKRHFSFVDRQTLTNQVLIQPRSDSAVRSVVELIDKEVYVLAGTKYESRLRNLNDELGGGVVIKVIPDTIGIDELIDMVSLKQIPFAIADNDLAALNNTYLKNIDYSVPVSFPQLSGWAVRKTSPKLLERLNTWTTNIENEDFYSALYHNYYTKNEFFTEKKITLFDGKYISPFDHLFKKHAQRIDWDWHLLASMAFYESAFDTDAFSPRGAVGLMQILPETAGMTHLELLDPDENLNAAIDYIKILDRIFGKVEDVEERAKFIMAAYNAGQGHVIDAMNLAEKYGKERYLWDDNVEIYMRLKTDPEYYNDLVCKSGYCRGEDIADYVRNVFVRYQRYLNTGIK